MEQEKSRSTLPKAQTGIYGLDEITDGGLPQGRPTLFCGDTGCGKTLIAMEFLVNGAVRYDEPGVFIAFEERVDDLKVNFASLGYDLNDLAAKKKLALDHIHIEKKEIPETGDYNLDGLFIRLSSLIDSIGAKRIVIDTIEVLFSGLTNQAILRAELHRLFGWLKEKGITAIITGERGEKGLTRHSLEEYVADCVILLEHRVEKNIATRQMRIVKYRGSSHAPGKFPFIISKNGVSFLPITSIGLKHKITDERISTGIPRLDTMMNGKGYYRGSSILVSGTAGTGKTSTAAHLAYASTLRKEKCIWFAFEESSDQIIRNMQSIGVDLKQAVDKGLLLFYAERPTVFGLEEHLLNIHRLVNEFKPEAVIVDPVSNFTGIGDMGKVKTMLSRLIDFFKMQQITALFTNLTSGGMFEETTGVGVSSLMDTWLLVRDIQSGAERNRLLHLLKSRGMSHSNQVREFLLTDNGIELQDVYAGPSGELLTGSARKIREDEEKADFVLRRQELKKKERELAHKKKAMEAKIAALQAEFEIGNTELQLEIKQNEERMKVVEENREEMKQQRKADR